MELVTSCETISRKWRVNCIGELDGMMTDISRRNMGKETAIAT